MNAGKTKFDLFVFEEAEKYRGKCHPIKVSLLHRLFARKVACKRMHPNPDDEFCNPDIGPNHEIISNYMKDLRSERNIGQPKTPFDERVMLQKIDLDGYMLLNGHHRWAAAMQMNVPKIRSEVVNLTQESDVEQMIQRATHDRRVTLDLDEVVFRVGDGVPAEKALSFPFNRFFREPLRRDIPGLLRYLKGAGYDIWVYTAKYYSMDYIRRFFALYKVQVDGVVTGTARKHRLPGEGRRKLEAMIQNRYPRTIHFDNGSLVCIDSGTKDFQEYSLSGNPDTWAREIMEIIGALDSHETEH